MRRVAVIVEQNWNAVPGGTAHSTNRLVDELLRTDFIDPIGVHGLHRRAPTLPLPASMPTRQVPIPGALLRHGWNRFERPSIDRHLADVDVVHGPAYELPPTGRGAVVTIHDLAFVRHPEWFTAHGARFLRRFLVQVGRRRPQVIVPSTHTADDCIAAGIDSARLEVVPWGADSTPIDPGRVAEVCRAHGVDEETVVFVGTREPRKNLHTLVEAMTRLPGRRLVVVGPSGWGEVELGGATVVGELAHDDVLAVMAGAGVLAYPSHLEGFGLPVLEAMTQGTAVVTTAGTAPADVAGEGAVAVDTGDPEAIADAIEGLLTDPDRRAAVGTAGRERAAMFTWRATAEATAAVYERAAS